LAHIAPCNAIPIGILSHDFMFTAVLMNQYRNLACKIYVEDL
jgi:hypothetical protein